ncbi:sugar phosphate nucleotidyltransferase, partial [Patescibacteria group bacterium]
VVIMKGVILAGGKGTRLLPITKVVDKNLLPVYDQPVIYYPLKALKKAGIKDILIVTSPQFADSFKEILDHGKELDLNLSYTVQKEAGGIAHALALAEEFAAGEKIAVLLSDNIFKDNLKNDVKDFENTGTGAKIFLKEVPDPERFGIAELDSNKVIKIEEKPRNPKTNYAVTGIYFYDRKVFEIIKTIKPSERGELEITDVNNIYVKNGEMQSRILESFWIDAGTFPSLAHATELVREAKEKNSF